MGRNKITQVTAKDIEDIINNSVQSAKNRLVGNAAEQKKLFVRPIANTDGTPNVVNLVQRLAEETEAAVEQLEKDVDALETPPPPDSLPLMGVFLTYDEGNETLQIVGEKGVSEEEVAGIVSEEVAPKLSEVEDKLSDKQDALAIADNYNAETNKVATETTVSNEIAKIIGGADASFDTLKEIADWIKAHPESVAEINSKIQTNAEKISTNETAISNLNQLSALLEENKQPKTDENLETESKEIVGAINELHNREDKQGLTEEQVKEIVQETLPDWAEQDEKPTYTYEEITGKPDLVEDIGSSLAEETNVLTIELKDKSGKVIATTQVTIPKGEFPDLSAYVKNTDYAKDTQTGVVQTSVYRGIQAVSNGLLIVRQPKDEYIDGRNSGADSATTFAVTLSKFDYTLRKALTDGQLVLTDEEKAKARALLGIE